MKARPLIKRNHFSAMPANHFELKGNDFLVHGDLIYTMVNVAPKVGDIVKWRHTDTVNYYAGQKVNNFTGYRFSRQKA